MTFMLENTVVEPLIPEQVTAQARAKPLLVCFSHLRWDFVFQRPQHLMTRLAEHFRILFWEEPRHADSAPALTLKICAKSGITVVTPRMPDTLEGQAREDAKRALLEEALAARGGVAVLWYYTPMMLSFSDGVGSGVIVYDCMDELSAFAGAPKALLDFEAALIAKADLVFTGGASLYEAKRALHGSVHCFPSAVDIAHFGAAREVPPGRSRRLGYFGVIDERLDLSLIAALADAHPEWTIEMVGPRAKIAEEALPQRANIVWAGQQPYDELPRWLARWDVALMPFARNEATRFISPTKAPEYLAGGRPVVSTSVADVVARYNGIDGVFFADTPEAFVRQCEAAQRIATTNWLTPVDALLATISWDSTANAMLGLVDAARRRSGTTAKPHYDVLVVGAGFAGSVMAERLASDAGKRVLVIDRRPHIAGNAFDVEDAAGILIHQYGPHIFHTNSDEVVAYLSRFTAWRPYEHRVLAEVRGQRVPMPINRTTLNALYGLDMTTEAEVETFLAERAEPVDPVRTSEDVVVGKVGRELYETFFRGYTRKQWGIDPSDLDKSVTARVPTRTNDDDRYFTDSFQAMPRDGYTAMFRAMLDHPNITLDLGTEFADIAEQCTWDHLVFTGPIDEYFDHRHGPLPYRSLRFEHATLDTEWSQPVATVNYPDEQVPYTRITEYKHLTGQVAAKTSITREYPSAEGDPYYPIPRAANEELYRRYRDLADQEQDVTFVGRLASYRYYNMDQVVAQALAAYRRLREREAIPVVRRAARVASLAA